MLKCETHCSQRNWSWGGRHSSFSSFRILEAGKAGEARRSVGGSGTGGGAMKQARTSGGWAWRPTVRCREVQAWHWRAWVMGGEGHQASETGAVRQCSMALHQRAAPLEEASATTRATARYALT